MIDELKVYKLDQACKILHVSYPTILNYIKTGKLIGIKVGGQWRIRHQDLVRFTTEGNEDNPTMDFENIDPDKE